MALRDQTRDGCGWGECCMKNTKSHLTQGRRAFKRWSCYRKRRPTYPIVGPQGSWFQNRRFSEIVGGLFRTVETTKIISLFQGLLSRHPGSISAMGAMTNGNTYRPHRCNGGAAHRHPGAISPIGLSDGATQNEHHHHSL